MDITRIVPGEFKEELFKKAISFRHEIFHNCWIWEAANLCLGIKRKLCP